MKSVQPRLVSDMDFRTDDVLSAQRQELRKSTEAKIDFDPRREGEDTVKPEAISNFLERLVVLSPKSVLLTGTLLSHATNARDTSIALFPVEPRPRTPR